MAQRTAGTTDMTRGRALPLILHFAVPMLIGNVFQQIYTVVDTMVVGHSLGDGAIAAIGATSALYSLLVDLAFGMNSGFSIVVTQRFGAKKPAELRRAVAGMMVLDMAVTCLLTLFSLAFLRPLLRYMNTPAAVFERAYLYIAVICGGMLATIGYNMFSAILRALGNSRAPLYFLIIASLLNVVLDLLLVVVIPLGVAGAALATVAAQLVSALLSGRYLWKNYRELMPGREDLRLDRALVGELLSTGFAMALMLCVVDLGSTVFQRANNTLGEAIITAHTASRRIMGILMQPISTVAAATSTFVGQNWGAGRSDRVRSALGQVLLLEVCYGLLACGVIFLSGAGLVRFTTGSTDLQAIGNAVLSLRCHFACFPALAVLLCLRSVMQAMGQKLLPILSSCIELAMKFFAAGVLIPRLGFLGTCITEPATWCLMTLFLLTGYLLQRQRWFGDRREESLQVPC